MGEDQEQIRARQSTSHIRKEETMTERERREAEIRSIMKSVAPKAEKKEEPKEEKKPAKKAEKK